MSATALLQKALENEEVAEVNRLVLRRGELIRFIQELDHQINRFSRSLPSDQSQTLLRKNAKNLRGLPRSSNRSYRLIKIAIP